MRILREFDEAVIRANTANTLDETAQMIVDSGRLLGFKRTRLWRCQFDKNSGEIKTFEGWAQSGNVGLDDFSTIRMPVQDSLYVPELLKHPHDIRVLESGMTRLPSESFLVRTDTGGGVLLCSSLSLYSDPWS